jgi:hypothetical protein
LGFLFKLDFKIIYLRKDTKEKNLVISTHGSIKKQRKVLNKEIDRSKAIRKKYFKKNLKIKNNKDLHFRSNSK